MAVTNSLYDNARAMFAMAQLHWENETQLTCALTKAVTFDATDVNLGDTVVSDIVATAALTGKDVTGNGACNADPVTFLSVPAGAGTIYAILIYVAGATALDPTGKLVAYLGNAVGLSITPNGGNIIVTWDTGPNKIFRL